MNSKIIHLSRPDISKKDTESVLNVLKTPHLALGPKLKNFEEKFCEYIGTPFGIAVNSGTSGLHSCLKSIEIKENDEVITSPFSFIASANCILFENAKPIFVDIDRSTLNINVNKIEKKISEKTRAILPVHVFGLPCEMDKILEIANKFDLLVIEDACEALGAEYEGKKTGTFGDLSVFAFYPNKQITTGEGGMIVTKNEEFATTCRTIINQGRNPRSKWLEHERLGFNYRMDEMSAALGLSQLERIEEILDKRNSIAKLYNEKLNEIDEIELLTKPKNAKRSWFVYIIILKNKISKRKIIGNMRDEGVQCGEYFPPIHLQPFYKNMFGFKEGDFPICEKISKATVALPFYNNIKEEEIKFVCEKLKKVIRKNA